MSACSRGGGGGASASAAAGLTATSTTAVATAPAAPSAPSHKPGSSQTIEPSGRATGLALEGDVLAFCDKRGARQLDLSTGTENAGTGPCKKAEPNDACEGFAIEVTVRAPGGGPNSILDIDGSPSYPMNGLVHDCAFDKGVLAVITGSELVTIDVKAQSRAVVSKTGGEQVAIDSAWIAWSDGSKLHAKHR